MARGALLVYNGTIPKRTKTILEITGLKNLEESPDLMVVKKDEKERSIGIDTIKTGIKYLQSKPFSKNTKFLIILSAEKLTKAAQNALLKTLEELPSYATLVLSSSTENDLLETVVSRCRKFPLKTRRESNDNTYSLIIKMSPGNRLGWAMENGKNERENTCELLRDWVVQARLLLPKSKVTVAKDIKMILETIQDLENSNLNQKLALETLVLNLH